MRFEIISKIVGDKFNSVENDHHENYSEKGLFKKWNSSKATFVNNTCIC